MKASIKQKVVLAYSGGLDTSVILKWLVGKGYEVIAYIADVGQNDDLKAAEEKALRIGASRAYIGDLKKEFVTSFIFRAIKANAVYEGKYLLGTSLARPLIAKKQIELAKKEKTNIVAHGATGKGNDQVRFELAYHTLMPNVKIISPWKDGEFLNKFQGRSALIEYCRENKIPVKATSRKPYSMDSNLMHISYESGILEDVSKEPSEDMFEMSVSPLNAPNKETKLEIEFRKGIPVRVIDKTNNVVESEPLKLFAYLNKIGGLNGIGRADIVENRFVGIKSRGVYETPGGTILMQAHLDMEGITMDREVKQIRDSFIPKIASLIYNGFWYSPEFELLMAMVDKSQENVTGRVNLTLYKGNVIITGRSSQCSLYDKEIASMETHQEYNSKDAEGFIKLNALRLKRYGAVKRLSY